MTIITNFNKFINEDYSESGDLIHKLQSFLKGKEKTIKDWFYQGMFNNATLADYYITKSTKKLAKSLIFEFSDGQFYYQVIFGVSLHDYNRKNGKFEKANLKVKKYSMNVDNEMNSLKDSQLDEWDSNNPENTGDGKINVEDFKPSYILDIISKMEDQTQAYGSEDVETLKQYQQGSPNQQQSQEGDEGYGAQGHSQGEEYQQEG